MRFVYTCLIVLAVLPALGLAPQLSVAQNDARELWRVRAQNITDDLLKDGNKLPSMRRALLWARLGQQWSRDDPRRAGNWFRNAVEVVEQIPNKENADERRERIQIARRLLNLIAPSDQKLAGRLTALLTTKESADAELTENVDSLITAAISLAEHDPKRAAEMGAVALRAGTPNDIAGLIFALRPQDRKLADGLFTQAMAAARQNLSPALINSLTYVVFPPNRSLSDNTTPDAVRAELLQLDIAYLNANANSTNREFVCALIGGSMASVLSEFERLVPQQAPVVRQAINKCQGLSPLLQQHVDSAVNKESLNTVESFLKAAEDAKDAKVRTVYRFRAAAMAQEKKDYERAASILDAMDKEDRAFMEFAWISFRAEWAAAAALDYYEHGRLLEMNLILDEMPSDLQALAKTGFVYRLPDGNRKEDNPTLQFLNDARVGLRKSNLSEAQKYGCYFSLVPLLVKHDPAEATAALKEAVASLNRAEPSTMDQDQRALDATGLAKTLPASLLEIDEFGVRESLAAITSVETRAQFRFGLLEDTLDRMRSASRK